MPESPPPQPKGRNPHLSEILIPEEAASFLRISPETLRQWRHLGEGPKYLKMGRSVRYNREHLENWLQEIAVEPSGSN